MVAKKVIGIYDEDVNFFDFGTYERFNLITRITTFRNGSKFIFFSLLKNNVYS